MSSTAAAPSEICEADPAVCTPFSRATGLSLASFSRLVSRRPSSRATVWVVPVGLPSSSRSGASMGTTWPAKRSSAQAWAARCWEARPKASVSSRVMPHLLGDALGPLELRGELVLAEVGLGDRARRGRASWTSSSRSGLRLIDSTPQAMATSTTPPATRAVARLVACWDEPHWVSTVVAATSRGSPALSQAVRVMLNDCSPTWLTQPPMTWPTSAGSMPVRSTRAASTRESSSAGWTLARPPLRRPMGVRTASTMTTSDMGAS